MLPFNPFSELASKIYGGIAIAAITFGAIQTVRIEGLSIWPLKIEGYAAENSRLKQDIQNIKKAQKEAVVKQDTQDTGNLQGQLGANKQLEITNEKLETARRDAVADYIATHRVRREAPGGSSCRPGQADLHRDPGQPDPGRSDGGEPLVAVRPEDIEAQSKVELQNTLRGLFIRGLIDQGLAIPQSQLKDIHPEFGENL